MGRGGSTSGGEEKKEMVLKVTSILSRAQRDIAEKEAKLLSRLSHPSIIKMYDTCYRTAPPSGGKRSKKDEDASKKDRPQHLILMEYCEGGGALQLCSKMLSSGTRFDLSTLIIAFGQICNAVSYLHAQRPPIVHRDLKPDNFLVKAGAYKLCDFGSAVFGHVDLKTPQARNEAEEVIEKTTTQMFRAPEMVDLFSAKKLTQATDVWALGCCLYSMAFLQNCFEEGSNLAILSRNYKIPEDNPYGDGLVELIDRMLTIDVKARCDMTEVILCLSAVYSGRPLPPRKEPKSSKKDSKSKEKSGDKEKTKAPRADKKERVGTFRTDGQGLTSSDAGLDTGAAPKAGKALNPNSVAARRKKSAVSNNEFSSFNNKFEQAAEKASKEEVNPDLAFATGVDHFAAFGDSVKGSASAEDQSNFFSSFDGDDADDANGAFDASQDPFATFEGGEGRAPVRRTRSSNGAVRRTRRNRADGTLKSDEADAIEAAAAAMSGESDDGGDENGAGAAARRKSRGRGVRRTTSSGKPKPRAKSKGRVRTRTTKAATDERESDSEDEQE